MKKLTATIDPKTGEVETDLSGYKGKGCHALQESLTKALGGKVLTEIKKPEFNEVVTSQVCIKR